MNNKKYAKLLGTSVLGIGLFFGVLSSTSSFAATAETNSDQYFMFGDPIIREVKEFQYTDHTGRMARMDGAEIFSPPEVVLAPEPSIFGDLPFILDKIINMGQKLWQLVEAGRPVANVQTVSANAIPQGITSWQGIEGWKAPISRVFQISFKNGFGSRTVGFTYRLLYTYGGSVNGKGNYLTHVTVIPADLSVLWGYHFSAQVEIPSVTNAGTSVDPIAAMEVAVSWKIDTVLKHTEGSSSYYVKGDGSFKDLSGGDDLVEGDDSLDGGL